jgi:succinyl-CoA synthetase beta subunit
MSFVELDGNIGCLVNGAGLAMSTVDLIHHHGGSANFLDIGSMASADGVKNAIKIITTDPKVNTIFVNIFGGMTKCDAIVDGLLQAANELKLQIPIVVRLQGTNYDIGRKMIQDAKINLITCDNFDEAAEMAIRCSQIMKLANDGNLLANLNMKGGIDKQAHVVQKEPISHVNLGV